MTRISETLRSFHHLESLPLPRTTEDKHPLSEHRSVIQQPQQMLELPKETLCVIRHWNKTTKMKSCTSSSITYELYHAFKTDELQFFEREGWPYFTCCYLRKPKWTVALFGMLQY